MAKELYKRCTKLLVYIFKGDFARFWLNISNAWFGLLHASTGSCEDIAIMKQMQKHRAQVEALQSVFNDIDCRLS